MPRPPLRQNEIKNAEKNVETLNRASENTTLIASMEHRGSASAALFQPR
jgi:hypothetical protein